MTKIETTSILKFKYDNTEKIVEKELQPSMETGDAAYAMNWMARFVAMECEKELRWVKFRENLPDVSFAMEERPYAKAAWESTDDVAAWENSQKVWQELHNVMLNVEYLMAQFRAYGEIEQQTTGDEWASPHLQMIHSLNAAVLQMSKIEDLFLVLIFVNSGASLLLVKTDGKLLPVVTSNPKWQRKLRRDRFKKALSLRGIPTGDDPPSNSYLDSLTNAEYQTLLEVFDAFFDFPAAVQIRGYRDKIAHRLQPAVDRPELYSQLMFPTKDGTRSTYDIGSRSSKVEYCSAEMYEQMKASLEHYVGLLKKLKAGIALLDV